MKKILIIIFAKGEKCCGPDSGEICWCGLGCKCNCAGCDHK